LKKRFQAKASSYGEVLHPILEPWASREAYPRMIVEESEGKKKKGKAS